MSTEQLTAAYLRLREELILAFATEPWRSCRPGHIRRLSADLGRLEDELQRHGVPDAVFVALVGQRADLEPRAYAACH